MSGALPPLFERLSAEADERPAFDDRALAESVRGELLRLERGAPPRLSWNTGLRRVEDGQRQRIDLDLRQPEVA